MAAFVHLFASRVKINEKKKIFKSAFVSAMMSVAAYSGRGPEVMVKLNFRLSFLSGLLMIPLGQRERG